MNDRYLFRAKRIDNGEWVCGSCVYTFCEDKNGIVVGVKVEKHWIVEESVNMVWVDEDTICQCTGLKDKNGNLVWENDILSISKKMDSIGNYYFPPIKYPVNVFVRWDLCAWLWETISKNKKDKYYISFPDAWCHYEAEVVGNIFDNPELINK